jgi:UPF0176 protein
MSKEYFILAFYHFTLIEDPHQEVAAHKEFFKNKSLTSRIYISEEGINGQMSGLKADAEEYMRWMHSRTIFETIYFKIHAHHENVFPRQTIKFRKQLVALDEEVDMSTTGEHLPPEKWKEMLSRKEDVVLLDVRNEYEWEVGRFDGATCPPCETFREFKEYGKELKKQVDPEKTPVMMYCTGGIRCELYSSLLMKEGFKKVYQLHGGIIGYGLQQGNQHWLGKLFVFDDRLTIPISDEESPVIGKCHHCKEPIESYYNCANMDCNHLFLCCMDCLPEYKGCCSEGCQCAERVRPYQQQDVHKPFKKWYHYFKETK